MHGLLDVDVTDAKRLLAGAEFGIAFGEGW